MLINYYQSLLILSKLSDVVKNDTIKKDVCNAKIKNIEDKAPNITNLAAKTSLNAKIIPIVINLVKKLTITQTLMKLKRKLCCKIKPRKFSKQKCCC